MFQIVLIRKDTFILTVLCPEEKLNLSEEEYTFVDK